MKVPMVFAVMIVLGAVSTSALGAEAKHNAGFMDGDAFFHFFLDHSEVRDLPTLARSGITYGIPDIGLAGTLSYNSRTLGANRLRIEGKDDRLIKQLQRAYLLLREGTSEKVIVEIGEDLIARPTDFSKNRTHVFLHNKNFAITEYNPFLRSNLPHFLLEAEQKGEPPLGLGRFVYDLRSLEPQQARKVVPLAHTKGPGEATITVQASEVAAFLIVRERMKAYRKREIAGDGEMYSPFVLRVTEEDIEWFGYHRYRWTPFRDE